MWDLIKRKIKAQHNGFWLETISLSYILLEIELRLLLCSKAGNKKIPPRKIDAQNFLMTLANLAKDNGFIDEKIWEQIQKFNEGRRKAIHRLAQGEIEYEDIKEYVKDTTELIGEIQSRWLPIKFGEVETRQQ